MPCEALRLSLLNHDPGGGNCDCPCAATGRPKGKNINTVTGEMAYTCNRSLTPCYSLQAMRAAYPMRHTPCAATSNAGFLSPHPPSSSPQALLHQVLASGTSDPELALALRDALGLQAGEANDLADGREVRDTAGHQVHTHLSPYLPVSRLDSHSSDMGFPHPLLSPPRWMQSVLTPSSAGLPSLGSIVPHRRCGAGPPSRSLATGTHVTAEGAEAGERLQGEWLQGLMSLLWV